MLSQSANNIEKTFNQLESRSDVESRLIKCNTIHLSEIKKKNKKTNVYIDF